MPPPEPQPIGPPEQPSSAATQPSKRELKYMQNAFRNAKDKWKIDGGSLKGFYLHSESGYLYCWDQPKGILYEFRQASGQCEPVWTSAMPQLNAEIWTVLPLPPTDPASLQSSYSRENLPNIDVYMNLIVAHESGAQFPADVLTATFEAFCENFELTHKAKRCLAQLPPAGQGYVFQNFRGDGNQDSSTALQQLVEDLKRRKPPPWGSSACTLRVEATGAIIGRCCPDLDALCRSDPPQRLAQAQCKIVSKEDRFFICDMETSEEGTVLDGFAVDTNWIGPLKSGSLLTLGPLRIKIQLSQMTKDTPLSNTADAAERKRVLDALAADETGGASLPAAGFGGEDEWKSKVFKRDKADIKKEAEARQAAYKDRAEDRRKRNAGEAGAAALDTLVQKFQKIQEVERQAEEAEANRVDMPTQEDFREGGMSVDGAFVGFNQTFERAGIGFGSTFGGAEFVPNVLDPKNLSQADKARMKTQMRYDEAANR